MKLPERVRKEASSFEHEFLEYLKPMLFNKKSSRRKAKAAPAKKASSTAVARAAKPVKVAAAPKIPAEPLLSRKASAQADVLFRRGSQTHRWQFLDDSGRWCNYDPDASREVERAYSNWLVSPHVDVRSVKSGTWEYMVDFNLMTQQNIKHAAHKIRKIQRIPIA